MKFANTVLGPISTDELGTTLIHEHLVYGYPGWYGDVTMGPLDRQAAVESVCTMLDELKSFGVKTVGDPTPNDGGRDPELLREAWSTATNPSVQVVRPPKVSETEGRGLRGLRHSGSGTPSGRAWAGRRSRTRIPLGRARGTQWRALLVGRLGQGQDARVSVHCDPAEAQGRNGFDGAADRDFLSQVVPIGRGQAKARQLRRLF